MSVPFHLLTATTQNKSSSSLLVYLPLILVAFYFLFYRPNQKKMQAQRQAAAPAYEVGDEVLTQGGIVGRILAIEADRFTLETSVGASFVVLQPYIVRKLDPVEPPTDVVGEDEPLAEVPLAEAPEAEATVESQQDAEAGDDSETTSEEERVEGDHHDEQ